MLGAIAGYDPADPTTRPASPVADYRRALARRRARAAHRRAARLFFAPLDAEVRAAVEAALATLARLGATVRTSRFPSSPTARAIFGLIVAEAKEIHADTLAHRPATSAPTCAALLSSPAGDAVSIARGAARCATYDRGVARRARGRRSARLADVPIGAPRDRRRDRRRRRRRDADVLRDVALHRALQRRALPALSLPCGFTPRRLPIGLQIAGRPFDEATVLRAGHAYEQATDWHRRRPRL